ncbi:MAG: prephenate dehydratase [Candidatus Berkelbacteria bacterium]
MKIGCLGPAGTFSEEAAIKYYKTEKNLIFFSSNESVIEALHLQDVDQAFVAIENSIEGPVNVVVDTIQKYPELHITGEYVLPICQEIMAFQYIVLKNIKTIVSHPQALAQCRNFIKNELPNAVIEEATSTTKAIEMIKNQKFDVLTTAAIGSPRAKTVYGLKTLWPCANDSKDNSTRFIAVNRTAKLRRTGDDRTSISFTCDKDEPGSLSRVLEVFSVLDINMLKIESRPIKKNLGDYLFLIDLNGHCNNAKIKLALETIKKRTVDLRILGSYPKFKPK